MFEKGLGCKISKTYPEVYNVNLRRIPISMIKKLVKITINELPNQNKKIGRPKLYPDELILTAFFIKTMLNISLRDILLRELSRTESPFPFHSPLQVLKDRSKLSEETLQEGSKETRRQTPGHSCGWNWVWIWAKERAQIQKGK